MTTVAEQATAKHRMVSLAWELNALVGREGRPGRQGRRVAKVRVTPVVSSRDGRMRQFWTVLALDAAGCEIPLPGLVVPVTNLLRAAFPDANWERAQNYNVTTGRLTLYRPRRPECLRAKTNSARGAGGA
jgi:hypothetical protein